MPNCIYVFLDEGGDFNFSSTGTCYYSFTSVTMRRDFSIYPVLDGYKYDVIEFGKELDHFHCTDDNPYVRQRVFGIIKDHLNELKIDSLVVRKCKTGTALQEPSKFYPRMLAYQVKYVLSGLDLREVDEVIVITDNLPVNAKRQIFQKAIKTTLAAMLPANAKYRVIHHPSRSHYGLQIADYCNWAIFKKWESGKDIHYQTIKPAITSEFDIFRTGTIRYYEDGRAL